MFDEGELNRVLDLQQKSYNAFKWFQKRTRGNDDLLDQVHERISSYQAAKQWVEKHRNNLPADARPDEGDVEPFAHLLASYLQTSFFLGKGDRDYYGCTCPFCMSIANARTLQVRNPNKKAHELAGKMKEHYIEQLAKDLDRGGISAEARAWITKNDDLAREFTLATYATELLRRARFASQGEGILVLWRDIAWKDGKPDNRFSLSTRIVLEAEQTIIRRMEDS